MKEPCTLLVFFVALGALTGAATGAPSPLAPAGADTRGGEGRAVVLVTSLEDAGPGTLREALTAGDRTIRFKVGGTIALRSSLVVGKPNTTIDGTDAPAPGVTISGRGVIVRDTRDVILRGLRIRDASDDNIQISGASENVLVENCSSTGAKDGAIDVVCDYKKPENHPRRVTVARCILADTPHAMLASTAAGLLLVENLFVGNDQRSPQLHNIQGFELRNNVIAEWGSYGTRIRASSRGNAVNNVYGPSRNPGKNAAAALILETEDRGPQRPPVRVFVDGNVMSAGASMALTGTSSERVGMPISIPMLPAARVTATVVAHAGARPLDGIDARQIQRVSSWVKPATVANPLRSETGVTRRELDAESDYLRGELSNLQRKLERLTGAPELRRPRTGSNETPPGLANSADFAAAIDPVKQGLADLAFAINRLKPRPAWSGGAHQKEHRFTSATGEFPLEAPAGVQVRTVTIANHGDAPVMNPRVTTNGRPDWFSTPDILAQTIRPGMSDREKAFALWEFVKKSRRHDHPGHSSLEFNDPVRMCNVYGYGYCRNAASVLAVLAERAGLKARVWGLKGHVVPEIHFDGGWRMLDPDEEVYYFEDDGKTIAGVELLQKRPDLIRQRQGRIMDGTETLVRIYTTAANNFIDKYIPVTTETRHTMAFTLRPGESLMRSTGNWGKYFSALYLEEPEIYGNGRFVHVPRWVPGRAPEGAGDVDNISVGAGPAGPRLGATDGQRPASITYRMAGPYPYLDGAVELAGTLPPGGRVALEFSEEGGNWQRVWETRTAGGFREAVSTAGWFRNGHGRPMYAYALRVWLEGGAALHGCKITSDIQVAPASLPSLHPGINAVNFRAESRGKPDVLVTFGYDAD